MAWKMSFVKAVDSSPRKSGISDSKRLRMVTWSLSWRRSART